MLYSVCQLFRYYHKFAYDYEVIDATFEQNVDEKYFLNIDEEEEEEKITVVEKGD